MMLARILDATLVELARFERERPAEAREVAHVLVLLKVQIKAVRAYVQRPARAELAELDSPDRPSIH